MIYGVSDLKTADKLAQHLGIDLHSVNRIKAGICFGITSIINEGHLYITVDDLKKKTAELLELEESIADELLKQGLSELYREEKIKLISHNNAHHITLSQYYFSEKGVASKLSNLLEQKNNQNFNIDEIYASLRAPMPGEIALNEDQQRGIMACLQNKITIITGGPGTGKTTLIKQLLAILEQYQCQYRIAAPTGRAAKRIQEGTGRFAMTIHRLLELDPSTMQFKHNEKNALKLDFLIIDEASMIDIFLAHAILKALPWNAHIVLLGDIDQLPSVGAGNFLNDLIASKKVVKTIKLTEIFRAGARQPHYCQCTPRQSRRDFLISSLPDAKRDFIYIKELEPENVTTHLKHIFTQQLARFGISQHNTAVLVPMNRGIVGTQKINCDLQQLLNPEITENQLIVAGSTFKIGDRVMQIRNNYDKIVFNGDVGRISDINREEQKISVFFGDRTVSYDFSEADELVLAYATSIHKSQGSEYDAHNSYFHQPFCIAAAQFDIHRNNACKKVMHFDWPTKSDSYCNQK